MTRPRLNGDQLGPLAQVLAAPRCKKCGTSKRLQQTHRRERGPDTYYRWRCPRCHNRHTRESARRRGQRFQKYGLTKTEYEQKLEEQRGLCAVCRQHPAVHIDHDHMSGKTRDILCQGCNHGLGNFKDDPVVIVNAAAYVVRHAA